MVINYFVLVFVQGCQLWVDWVFVIIGLGLVLMVGVIDEGMQYVFVVGFECFDQVSIDIGLWDGVICIGCFVFCIDDNLEMAVWQVGDVQV